MNPNLDCAINVEKCAKCKTFFCSYKTAKLPLALNSSMLFIGIILCLTNRDLLRIGVLFILVSVLGYAVIIAYCQLPLEDDLFLAFTGQDPVTLSNIDNFETSETKSSSAVKNESCFEDPSTTYTALL